MAFRGGVQLRLPLFHHRFGGAHFALSLIEQRFGGGDRALRLFNLGGRFEALFVQHPNIHPRQHLALVNKLPLFDQNGVDASGSFGGDIHLSGFYSAVAAGKALRKSRRT